LTDQDPDWVIVGRISGLFGVRGWVKVFSETEPRGNILNYPCWYLGHPGGWKEHKLLDGRPQGKGIVASIEGYDDRDRAGELIGVQIAVRRDQLPAPAADEYYWTDLEGLKVQTRDGIELGRVDHLFATGANDVLVVKGDRQRLIPFIEQVVLEVEPGAGRLIVDWDPEF
jgi:16S rRNA processing protein RimM